MKKSIIYLLGAGRSGTTLLASLLNTHSSIQTVGEMHFFLEYYFEDKTCSCGKRLRACDYWSKIVDQLTLQGVNESNYTKIESKHNHRNIIKAFFSNQEDKEYTKAYEEVFNIISLKSDAQWIVDSSKYITRYLLLRRSKNLAVKGIFLVRDVRGVIDSFEKKVQTPRSPISTVLYYFLINLAGELVNLTHKDVIKVRYEDLIMNTSKTLQKIGDHFFEEESAIKVSGEIITPHFIGGNRMVKKRSITINPTINWRSTMKRHKQIRYYLLCLPLMLINKYKV